MIVVPQAFFSAPSIKTLLRDEDNCLLFKETKTINPNSERYLSAHALTIVKSGKLMLRTQEGHSFEIRQREMVFIPRGLYFISDIIPTSLTFSAYVFFFQEDLINEFLNEYDTSLHGSELKESQPEVYAFEESFQYFLDGLIKLYNGQNHQQIVRLKLKEFLYLILNAEGGASFRQSLLSIKKRKKESVKTFMEANFSKALKIEDYAYLTGRSLSTFHRDFKRQFGKGPKEWLMDKRLLRSKEMLDQGLSMSVTQLAYETGYDNISHFIKTFQKKFGASPKQYQIELRKNQLV